MPTNCVLLSLISRSTSFLHTHSQCGPRSAVRTDSHGLVLSHLTFCGLFLALLRADFKYKFVSALPKDQEMYGTYQKYTTLILLDLSFSLAWVRCAHVKQTVHPRLTHLRFQIVLGFADFDTLALSLNASAIFVSILWASIGWIGAIREQKSLMYCFWFSAILWPAFVGYQAFLLVTGDGGISSKSFNLAACGLSTILTRLLLLWVSSSVAGNFGQGLREKVFAKQWAQVANCALRTRAR